MEDISTITAFLGWCAVINLGIYLFTVIVLTLFKAPVKNLHSKLTGVPLEKLDELYFNYLGHFKLAIILLSITPYIALKVLSN
jgi:hypothetical protein